MELDKTRAVFLSPILTSPVAEERRNKRRHDADVEHVRDVVSRDQTIEEFYDVHI